MSVELKCFKNSEKTSALKDLANPPLAERTHNSCHQDWRAGITQNCSLNREEKWKERKL